jgi:hypothetical protein
MTKAPSGAAYSGHSADDIAPDGALPFMRRQSTKMPALRALKWIQFVLIREIRVKESVFHLGSICG